MKQNGKHTSQHNGTHSTNYSDYDCEIVIRNPNALSTKLEPLILELIENGFDALPRIQRRLAETTIYGKIDYAHLNAAVERLAGEGFIAIQQATFNQPASETSAQRNIWTTYYQRTDKTRATGQQTPKKRNRETFVAELKEKTKFGSAKHKSSKPYKPQARPATGAETYNKAQRDYYARKRDAILAKRRENKLLKLQQEAA